MQFNVLPVANRIELKGLYISACYGDPAQSEDGYFYPAGSILLRIDQDENGQFVQYTKQSDSDEGFNWTPNTGGSGPGPTPETPTWAEVLAEGNASGSKGIIIQGPPDATSSGNTGIYMGYDTTNRGQMFVYAGGSYQNMTIIGSQLILAGNNGTRIDGAYVNLNSNTIQMQGFTRVSAAAGQGARAYGLGFAPADTTGLNTVVEHENNVFLGRTAGAFNNFLLTFVNSTTSPLTANRTLFFADETGTVATREWTQRGGSAQLVQGKVFTDGTNVAFTMDHNLGYTPTKCLPSGLLGERLSDVFGVALTGIELGATVVTFRFATAPAAGNYDVILSLQ